MSEQAEPCSPASSLIRLGKRIMTGAVLTVASAWLIAITVNPANNPYAYAGPFIDSWRTSGFQSVLIYHVCGSSRVLCFQGFERPGYSRTRVDGPLLYTRVDGPVPWPCWCPHLNEADAGLFVADGRGWPFIAFRGSFRDRSVESDPPKSTNCSETRTLICAGRFKSEYLSPACSARVLPFGVYWPGFLANVLLYACLWHAFATAYRCAVRAVRKRRGVCESCGYPLVRQQGACPECGAATKSATPPC